MEDDRHAKKITSMLDDLVTNKRFCHFQANKNNGKFGKIS